MSLGCRFYEKAYPEKDDCVVVQFSRDLPHIGVYCSLLEYNGLEGMLKLSEMTRLRLSKQPHAMKPGQTEVVRVISVNPEKGFIDLSRIRDLNPMVIAETEDRWNKGKRVHTIMRNVAKKTGVKAEDMYKMFAWPAAERYGSSYAAVEMLLRDSNAVFDEFNIPMMYRELLLETAKERMKPEQKSITIPLEIQLPTQEGVTGIRSSFISARKEVLNRIFKGSSQDCSVKILCRKAPRYTISVTTLDELMGKKIVMEIVKMVSDDISRKGGRCKSSSRPDVKLLPVTERKDDGSLALANLPEIS